MFLCLAGLQALLCLVGAALVWNAKPGGAAFVIVLVIAALLRLGLLFETPKLSDDIYRYIWDGRVQSAGINPYQFIPANPQLTSLRDRDIYPHINRREYAPTIYPPMAQVIFFAIHQVSGSVTGFKACLLLFEATTIWALARLLPRSGLPRERVLIYAWNPLVLWEFAGSGHIDAAMIAFIALAFVAREARRESLTGFFLGAAALTKFFPLVLLPALYRRWDWKMPAAAVATFCLGYLPYLGAGWHVLGFLSVYADEEGMRSGRYFLLQLVRFIFGGAEIPVELYAALVLIVLMAIARRALFRMSNANGKFIRDAGVLAFAFTFLLSPQFAWYWSWSVPFLAFLPWRTMAPLFLAAAGALVHYGRWFDTSLSDLHRHLALGLFQFAPAAMMIGVLFVLQRKPGLFPSLRQKWTLGWSLPAPDLGIDHGSYTRAR